MSKRIATFLAALALVAGLVPACSIAYAAEELEEVTTQNQTQDNAAPPEATDDKNTDKKAVDNLGNSSLNADETIDSTKAALKITEGNVETLVQNGGTDYNAGSKEGNWDFHNIKDNQSAGNTLECYELRIHVKTATNITLSTVAGTGQDQEIFKELAIIVENMADGATITLNGLKSSGVYTDNSNDYIDSYYKNAMTIGKLQSEYIFDNDDTFFSDIPNFNTHIILADGSTNILKAMPTYYQYNNEPAAGIGKLDRQVIDQTTKLSKSASDEILKKNQLIISGNGSLECYGVYGGAGIGGFMDEFDTGVQFLQGTNFQGEFEPSTSYITINGGNIKATGDQANVTDSSGLEKNGCCGAGIGGSLPTFGSDFTKYTGQGDHDRPDLVFQPGNATHITINGGNVDAYCCDKGVGFGAGIGGGGYYEDPDDGNGISNLGTTGSAKVANLSADDDVQEGRAGSASDITINGGVVNAACVKGAGIGYGAGIGGGSFGVDIDADDSDIVATNLYGGDATNIKVTGGEVNACGTADPTFDMQSTLIPFSQSYGPGIGGGSVVISGTGANPELNKSGTLDGFTVTGGVVNAYGSKTYSFCPGIGSGVVFGSKLNKTAIGDCKNVTISGGTVNAASGQYYYGMGAGIGTSFTQIDDVDTTADGFTFTPGNCSNINITGGAVNVACGYGTPSDATDLPDEFEAMMYGPGIGNALNFYTVKDGDSETNHIVNGSTTGVTISGQAAYLLATGGSQYSEIAENDYKPLPIMGTPTFTQGAVYTRQSFSDEYTTLAQDGYYGGAVTIPSGQTVYSDVVVEAGKSFGVAGATLPAGKTILNKGTLTGVNSLNVEGDAKVQTTVKFGVDGTEQTLDVKTAAGIGTYSDIPTYSGAGADTFDGWYTRNGATDGNWGVKVVAGGTVDANAHVLYPKVNTPGSDTPVNPSDNPSSDSPSEPDPYTPAQEQQIVDELSQLNDGTVDDVNSLSEDTQAFYHKYVEPYQNGSLEQKKIPVWAQKIMKEAGILKSIVLPDNATNVIPGTGDTTSIVAALCVIAAAGCAFVLARKRG